MVLQPLWGALPAFWGQHCGWSQSRRFRKIPTEDPASAGQAFSRNPLSAVFPLGCQTRQAFVSAGSRPGHRVPRALENASPIFLREHRQTHSQACIGHESSCYSKEEEGSGKGTQAAIFPEFLGPDTGSKQEEPQVPRRSKTQKEYGENLRGPQDTCDPPPNMSKNWTLRQTSSCPSCQTVPHRSWSNKINLSDCSILWVSTFPSHHKRTKITQDLQTGFHSLRNSESFKVASMSFVK